MAQSSYVKSSEVLANFVHKEAQKIPGLQSRGARQAGFFVLVGSAMPNILVETAFVSNRKDEKFLKSAAGQQKIAEALYHAIRKYRVEYEKLLTNG
jgi:N-acetylmuramoyl-L-alanine amidase